jgi:hypothetical protein
VQSHHGQNHPLGTYERPMGYTSVADGRYRFVT